MRTANGFKFVSNKIRESDTTNLITFFSWNDPIAARFRAIPLRGKAAFSIRRRSGVKPDSACIETGSHMVATCLGQSSCRLV
jgi:hypothetical protein